METPETHIQKILEAIQLFKKHDTSITLPPDKWVSVFSVMEEYASIRAEQARREAINSLHIEIHNKIVETRVELYKATQNEIVDRKLYDLDIFIGQKADAAAGYGKE